MTASGHDFSMEVTATASHLQSGCYQWQMWPAAPKGTQALGAASDAGCLVRMVAMVAMYALVTHALQPPQVRKVPHNNLNAAWLQVTQLHSWLAQASS
jgi:hypothetical protein